MCIYVPLNINALILISLLKRSDSGVWREVREREK